MTETDLCFLPATELAARIRKRAVSPVEVIDALATRIKDLNPKLNAYISLDLTNARKEAEHRAKLQNEHPGENLGPLFGVPVAIKDDLAVKGLRLTNGSRLCDQLADYDDVTVSRLRRAGAIIVGKTHLPEFGHKGTTDNVLGPDGRRVVTVNPWDTSRTAGGSSGGSGAAVAAGLAYLAVGTDIAGSVRMPASFCGLVGLKPSFGMIPRAPSGNAFTLWVSGPLTRTVGDACLAMKVLAGPDDRDRFCLTLPPGDTFDLSRELPPLRIGWCASPTGGPVEPAVETRVRAALDILARKTKATIVDRKSPMLPAERMTELLGALIPLFRVGCLGELRYAAKLGTRDDYQRVADTLSPTLAEFLEPAWDLDLPRYLAAQAAVTEFCEGPAAKFFEGIDLLATPTLAVPAFDRDLPLGPMQVAGKDIDPHLGWGMTWPFNLTGQPAVSVPAGWTDDRLPLPVGLQLVGQRGQDGLVLRAAAAVEAVSPWTDRRPPQ